MGNGNKHRAALHGSNARDLHPAARDLHTKLPPRDPRVQAGRMARAGNSPPRSDRLDETLRAVARLVEVTLEQPDEGCGDDELLLGRDRVVQFVDRR